MNCTRPAYSSTHYTFSFRRRGNTRLKENQNQQGQHQICSFMSMGFRWLHTPPLLSIALNSLLGWFCFLSTDFLDMCPTIPLQDRLYPPNFTQWPLMAHLTLALVQRVCLYLLSECRDSTSPSFKSPIFSQVFSDFTEFQDITWLTQSKPQDLVNSII